jgi:hypothetical protein
MNKSKTVVSEIEQRKEKLKPGQAVLEVHVKRERRASNSNYIKAKITGTLTIKGHVFHHVDGNLMGLIAYICGIRSVYVFSKNAEPNTMARAAFFHPSLLKEWLCKGDEGRYLKRFGIALHTASREFVEWWERERMPIALAEVPQELRVHTKLEGALYDRQGELIQSTDIERAQFDYAKRKMLENQDGRNLGRIRVGNVVHVSRTAFQTHRPS